jgi:FkbM family methyltransferase
MKKNESYWSESPLISTRKWRQSQAANWLAVNRKSAFVKRLARFASAILDAYENNNHSIRCNGEWSLLQRLSQVQLNLILDVGAHYGEWAILACGLWPRARVVCFEIDAEIRRTLAESVRTHPNIEVYPGGMADRNERAEYHYFGDAPGYNSLIAFPHREESTVRSGIIIAGDDYADTLNGASVDLLKIDVEGAEYRVLRGFQRAFEAQNIRIVQFEYGYANIAAGALLKDIYEFLGQRGYEIGKVYPDGIDFCEYEYIAENFRGANCVAIKKTDEEVRALIESG